MTDDWGKDRKFVSSGPGGDRGRDGAPPPARWCCSRPAWGVWLGRGEGPAPRQLWCAARLHARDVRCASSAVTLPPLRQPALLLLARLLGSPAASLRSFLALNESAALHGWLASPCRLPAFLQRCPAAGLTEELGSACCERTHCRLAAAGPLARASGPHARAQAAVRTARRWGPRARTSRVAGAPTASRTSPPAAAAAAVAAAAAADSGPTTATATATQTATSAPRAPTRRTAGAPRSSRPASRQRAAAAAALAAAAAAAAAAALRTAGAARGAAALRAATATRRAAARRPAAARPPAAARGSTWPSARCQRPS